MNNDSTERELIAKFLLTEFKPRAILTAEHCEAIQAAQARLHRQISAASKAGSARSRKKTGAARAAIKARWDKRRAEEDEQ